MSEMIPYSADDGMNRMSVRAGTADVRVGSSSAAGGRKKADGAARADGDVGGPGSGIERAGERKADGNVGGPRGWYSRGYLPHRDSIGLLQAITFRLADSLPQNKLAELEVGSTKKADSFREVDGSRKADEDVGVPDCADEDVGGPEGFLA